MIQQNYIIDQVEFTSLFCARPQNFACFLGAGASARAGVPTATDVLWELKRKYYCREENQDISRQDLQNDAIRAKIQSFLSSRGFPALWAENDYPSHLEKIFGEDKERQRQYLKGILSENKATVSVGNRVLDALIASGFCRTAFRTNFDSIVEKAVAEVSGLHAFSELEVATVTAEAWRQFDQALVYGPELVSFHVTPIDRHNEAFVAKPSQAEDRLHQESIGYMGGGDFRGCRCCEDAAERGKPKPTAVVGEVAVANCQSDRKIRVH